MIRKSALKYLLLSAILISVFFSCDEQNLYVGSSNLPKIITITNMDTTIFNIDIGTGIR